jgi:hypothetical protein
MNAFRKGMDWKINWKKEASNTSFKRIIFLSSETKFKFKKITSSIARKNY